MSLKTYQRYPDELSIRKCEADWYVRITTLRDLRIASSRELNNLYSLRWNIEVDWCTIKVTMNMDMFRCLSPDMVRKEITVHLIAYNPGSVVRWFPPPN